jgi:hypothetical protein
MKKIFFLTALAVTVLVSCGKDNDAGSLPNSPEGEKATLSIKMTFPNTYANEDATPEESTVNTVHVFIFEDGPGNLINHVALRGSDFQKTGNLYTAHKGIVTIAGQRRIGVGINLPADIVSTITTKGNISAVNDQTVHNVNAEMIASNNKFVMFNADMPLVNVVSDETKQPGDNEVSMNIERLAGKAALAKSSDFSIDVAQGNFIGDFEYKLMQTSKKSYLMRDPAGKDPNYISGDFITSGTPVGNQYDASAFENTALPYKVVEPASNDYSTREAFYGAENTADFYLRGTTTYFLVRALFKPTQFSDDQGNTITPNYNEGDDFWSVSDGNVMHICVDATTANDLAAYLGTGATVTQHEGAYCYWPVWIGSKSSRAFLRNNYYVGRIKSIKGLGEGSEASIVGPNPVIPPDEPVDDKATIECDFTILHWSFNLADPVELQ